MKEVFEYRTRIPASAERVFAWHERPEALQKLIPPGDPVTILEHTGGIRDGARVVLAMGYRPFKLRWVARHKSYVEGRQFIDFQEKGPFKFWEHTHIVEPDGPDACFLLDHIEYELPFGALGRFLGGRLARKKLEKTFAYRHSVTLADNR
ncbi:MAG: SRPBCC family protein [Acidobacteriota bacterium]|nr:SRPBCC family protein [Acidobacteriota bacterium]